MIYKPALGSIIALGQAFRILNLALDTLKPISFHLLVLENETNSILKI